MGDLTLTALIRATSALSLCVALSAGFGATVVSAQETAPETVEEADGAADSPAGADEPASPETEETESSDPAAGILSTGEPVAPANRGPAIYVREEHGDWEIRCLEAPEGQEDPCQMFQRLSDAAGNPTADINIFDLPDGNDIVAGGTLLTPLRTLLTAQVTVTVDGGQARRYPFAWCDESGCYARLGFTASDVASFRRGAKANIVVVPAQAPDQPANLTMSLTGFTAGYQAVTVDN